MAELNNKLQIKTDSLIENKDILYNCTECSSLIEVLSINEDKNIIKFKCLNKNCGVEKTKLLNEYFEKMEKYKQKNINEDTCRIHISCKNNKYVSYCFDCNSNLCEECLKTREHICHNKNYILEIKPINEELNIIEKVIEDYKIRIKNLKNEKINTIKELDNLLNVNKQNENDKLKNQIKSNEIFKNKEIKLNRDKYITDINEIKNRYEKEIKERKNQYKKDEDNINNFYKLREEKEYIIHKIKIEEIDKKYNDSINNLTYDKTIERMVNTKKINEVIYNTYNLYNNNYYNSVNINNIMLSYLTNEHIKNKIMKKILNNKFEEIVNIILKKRDGGNKINLRKEKEEKTKSDDDKLQEIIKEKEKKYREEIKRREEEEDKYRKEIKEREEKEKKYIKEIKEREEIEEKYKNEIKEKEEKYRKEIEEMKKKISYKYLFFIIILYNLL